MTQVADCMQRVAAAGRLEGALAAFRLAVATGGWQQIAVADFVLRDAAEAAVADLRVGDVNAPMIVALLLDAIAALRESATTFAQEARGPQASLGQRTYMRMGSEGGAK